MKKRDILTLMGLILGWVAILAGAKIEGLQFTSLFKLSSFFVVVIGSFAATCTGFTMEQIKAIPPALRRCFYPDEVGPVEIARIIIEYAQKARHQGLLGLEKDVKKLKDVFFKKSLQLLIDGNNIDNIRNIMETEIIVWEKRERIYENFLKAMGGFSPTLGIIGTVMGLIQVMSNLGEPNKIASGIATSFISTFYGISFANLIFLPVASKLKLRREEDLIIKQMILEGVISIGSGDSSLLVMEKLFTYLNSEEKLRILRQG